MQRIFACGAKAFDKAFEGRQHARLDDNEACAAKGPVAQARPRVRHVWEERFVDGAFDAAITEIWIDVARVLDKIVNGGGQKNRQIRCAYEHKVVGWKIV